VGGLDVLRTAVLCGGEGQAIVNDGGEDQNRKGEGNGSEDAVFHGVVWVVGYPDRSGQANSNEAASEGNLKKSVVAILDAIAAPSVDVLCANPMDTEAWEWMQLKPDPSSAFNIEKEARRLEQTPNAGPIAAQLFRAWNMQQTLLQQATNRIAALELQIMEHDRQAGT